MQKLMGLMPGMGELNKMMKDVDAEGETKRLFGIIDSMTAKERQNPNVIDPSRRKRIAAGAGVEPHEVNELVKQFDGMAALMKSMAGKGVGDRLKMMREMQQGGLLDPNGRLAKPKQSTGKRLSAKERAKMKRERDRMLRKKRRESRNK